MALDAASKHVAQNFNITDTNNNGKPVMRCSKCEEFSEKDRGKGFLLLSTAITKAKEHIVVYCPGIVPKDDVSDANLMHTLLINLSLKAVSTMSKQGIAMRNATNLACYCSMNCFEPLTVYTCMMHFILLHTYNIYFFTVCILYTCLH